ncbi:reverse transcriptase domain-containing protein [Caenispirillum salinarum]|uniref:reverse transcriptase domain-containing protein n=1 Tax=Caenispirillum salinarum TaxID=859058 RepID=UPI001360B4FC|nr:reverse transcriptase domain-containing protein [Caenispirillum salinarum]
MTSKFELKSEHLKNYPHFDAPLSKREIMRLVTDKRRVAQNTFYPLFLYNEEWQPYRSVNGPKPDKKSRPIRYGARRDAYIFTYYRHLLSGPYERRLKTLGIEGCPIAYRKIPKPGSNSGKCNIDFAKDAFEAIDHLKDCVAIALDIEGYFENLDHSMIKSGWRDLLGAPELPEDHYAVFRNITKYHYVDQREVYRRLGFIKSIKVGASKIDQFTVPYRKMPKQLCKPEEFRAKICGYDPAYSNLVESNKSGRGIPQGAPISDLIANFYLLDFDVSANDFVKSRGGFYMRYSDDILLILPGAAREADDAVNFVKDEIKRYGSELRIKDKKTCVVQFRRDGPSLRHEHIYGPQGRNGLEYLGFRYDGKRVYIRDSTISRLYRKVSIAAKREAARHVRDNKSLGLKELKDSFNYSLLSQRFARVQKEHLSSDYRSWTFYTYLKRASATFGRKGNRILGQARRFDALMRLRVNAAIDKAYYKR